MSSPKTIKPPALRRGDKIGLIAPASDFNLEAFSAGCDRLRQMGYEPVYSDGIFERDLYFAGSASRRFRELEDMLLRADVKALIGVRGGYGSNYLLERLDFKKFSAHPKIILGCSDLTSLLTSILDSTGHIVMLHRLDNTQYGSIAVAEDKARSALDYRRPTKVFEDLVAQGYANREPQVYSADEICHYSPFPDTRAMFRGMLPNGVPKTVCAVAALTM